MLGGRVSVSLQEVQGVQEVIEVKEVWESTVIAGCL